MSYPQSPVAAQRWQKFRNIGKTKVPPFGCLEIISEEIRDGARVLLAQRPTSSFALYEDAWAAGVPGWYWGWGYYSAWYYHPYLRMHHGRFAFNSHVPIPPDGFGDCTQDYPARALVDYGSPTSPPFYAGMCGPVADQYELGIVPGPFHIITVDSSGAVSKDRPTMLRTAWVSPTHSTGSMGAVFQGLADVFDPLESVLKVLIPATPFWSVGAWFRSEERNPQGNLMASELYAPATGYYRGTCSATISLAASSAPPYSRLTIGLHIEQGAGKQVHPLNGQFKAHRYRPPAESPGYEEEAYAENVCFPFLVYLYEGNKLYIEQQSSVPIHVEALILEISNAGM